MSEKVLVIRDPREPVSSGLNGTPVADFPDAVATLQGQGPAH